jgi:hypothetical protein
MKIRRVGAEIFHEDGRTHRRTEMTKLAVAFRNFANAHKNSVWNQKKLTLKIGKLLLNYSESNQTSWIIFLKFEFHV